MASQKNQHFVPQFYLRNFSGSRKTIGCLHLSSGKIIHAAPIRSQCSHDYFYGTDGKAEKTLALLEGSFSEIFKRIITTGMLPLFDSNDMQTILLFISIQRARTEEAASILMSSMNMVTKEIFMEIAKKNGFPEDQLPTLTTENPVGHTLRMAVDSYPLLQDLGIKLVHNGTNIPFITSDHPVIFYNRFFENNENNESSGSTGIFSAGLQIFLPISPKYLIVLFDTSLYSMANKHTKSILCTFARDIVKLN
jgi:hypothetical protein